MLVGNRLGRDSPQVLLRERGAVRLELQRAGREREAPGLADVQGAHARVAQVPGVHVRLVDQLVPIAWAELQVQRVVQERRDLALVQRYALLGAEEAPDTLGFRRADIAASRQPASLLEYHRRRPVRTEVGVPVAVEHRGAPGDDRARDDAKQRPGLHRPEAQNWIVTPAR